MVTGLLPSRELLASPNYSLSDLWEGRVSRGVRDKFESILKDGRNAQVEKGRPGPKTKS